MAEDGYKSAMRFVIILVVVAVVVWLLLTMLRGRGSRL
jgi:hypothetical protein